MATARWTARNWPNSPGTWDRLEGALMAIVPASSIDRIDRIDPNAIDEAEAASPTGVRIASRQRVDRLVNDSTNPFHEAFTASRFLLEM